MFVIENIGKSKLNFKAVMQPYRNPSKYEQVSTKIMQQGPPRMAEMTDRELIKEQFYLSRFLHHLTGNSNLPTLPNSDVLYSIKD